MFTFIGETVLDPFLGSGTTSLAAILTNRNSIGYEVNEDFLPVIKEKIEGEQSKLFTKCEFFIKKQQLDTVNWEKEIQQLPYRFSDPVQFDKKVDPHAMKFGSKISLQDVSGAKREDYFNVKEILDMNHIQLNDGRIIRLIGVKPNQDHTEAALAFLSKKILKRPIYLRYDEKHDMIKSPTRWHMSI